MQSCIETKKTLQRVKMIIVTTDTSFCDILLDYIYSAYVLSNTIKRTQRISRNQKKSAIRVKDTLFTSKKCISLLYEYQ